MSEWQRIRLGDYAETFAGGTPDRGNAAFFGGSIPWVKSTEVNLGRIRKTEEFLTDDGFHFSAAKWIPARTVLVALYGATAAQIAYLEIAATANQAVLAVIPDEHIDSIFLFYALTAIKEKILFQAQGSGQPNLNKQIIDRVTVDLPPLFEQRRIAEILSTLDEAIEQTEALIAKHKQIKAGLIHDLFTRGVTPDGHLRPTREQAPDLYKESPLGWIPKEWSLKTISVIADSLVDGPFGSNLKSEHYVDEPGVRVVRLQNIQDGYYNDRDPVFVSQRHAEYLMRNAVNPGDVLIAALGDESYPVGRACCYPPELPPAINKADCFRLRCHPEVAINTYLMHFLNTAAARNQVKRFEQGVTRRRTNLGNLRRVIAALPSLDEQECIIQRLAVAGEQISTGELQVEKFRQQKYGLMHDLLTDRAPVNGTG